MNQSYDPVIETKTKILDTAERLFGERGYSATSLRDIVAGAGVNLAAVHYHFGSKEELLDQVVLRKAAPVNVERLRLLDQVEAEAGTAPPPVDQVLEAFFLPMAAAAECNPPFVRMMGRMLAEGLMMGIVAKHFQEVTRRTQSALRRALPQLPEEELLWRIHFMIGAMAHTMCGPPDFTQRGADLGDFRSRIGRLVSFLSGGFQAPIRESREEQ